MIFITENDVMGANLPVYHADRIVEDIVEKEKREEKIAMIAKMKRVGKLSNEDIAEITGFTVEEIEGLTENNAAVAN